MNFDKSEARSLQEFVGFGKEVGVRKVTRGVLKG